MEWTPHFDGENTGGRDFCPHGWEKGGVTYSVQRPISVMPTLECMVTITMKVLGRLFRS